MLYERLLDLAPETRLERRLAERVAARFVIGLLLAIPVCVLAAAMLASGIVHALAARICEAGLRAGRRIRADLDAVRIAPRRDAPRPGTRDRVPGC